MFLRQTGGGSGGAWSVRSWSWGVSVAGVGVWESVLYAPSAPETRHRRPRKASMLFNSLTSIILRSLKISPRGTFMNRIRSPRDEDEWRRGSRHAWRDGDRAPGRGVQERPRKGSLDIGGGRAAAIPSAARSPFPRGPVAIRGTGNVDKEQQPHRLRIRLIRHNSYRSEEHTSELQSLKHLVCRLLLEKKQ